MMRGKNILNGLATSQLLRYGRKAATSLIIGLVSANALAGPAITDISFNSQTNGQLSIALEFDSAPSSEFSSYTIEDPARIVVDFPDIENRLPQRRYALPSGNASSVVVLEAGNRSRMIVNLAQLGEFKTTQDGRRFLLEVGADVGGSYVVPAMSEASAVRAAVDTPARSAAINNLEFMRGDDNEGQLILSLSDSSVDVNVFSEGNRISLELMDTEVSESLSRRYDVNDFATPVSEIEVVPSDRGTRVVLTANGYFDYLAYQQGGEYVVSVQALSKWSANSG